MAFTGTPLRHLVATAFVAWQGRLLLHRHARLDMWLPCGGHVDPGETPDEAALREVREESGVEVELLDDRALEVAEPRQLVRPRGVQLETVGPGHEHIDFIYFAVPKAPYEGALITTDPTMAWYPPEEVDRLDLTEELRAWTRLATEELLPLSGALHVPG